ncbi:MAG: hypothetical protein Q4G26_00100 [Paracoccus sp. (in: a-proteobacteria)]|nr:hypothetical protein [Paracoccus sp. (in: a-proteobacteria)]
MTDAAPPLPPQVELPEITADREWRVVADTAYLWFVPRNRVLLVSFDNLATLDHPYPRLPWLYRQAGEMGYSILGVQSHAKDWFRQKTAPDLLRHLADARFFDAFDRVIFTGASMGGFAALNFAPLVPGATVLAFSPQSTMSQAICPFEKRYSWAVKNSDWTTPQFLDASAAIPYLPRATVLFDPLVPEDRQHAARLAAPHVQQVKLNHATHEAIRVVVKAGALNPMLAEFAETGRLGPVTWGALRKRRMVRKWARSFTENLLASRHPGLALPALNLLEADGYYFATKARQALLERHISSKSG